MISNHDIGADSKAHFKSMSLIGSALEHGMLEQLMGSNNQAVSTMKLFKIANLGGDRIYYADSSNFPTVRSHLEQQPADKRYSDSDINNFQYFVNNGYALVLPDNGQLIFNTWKGKGYIAKKFDADGSMSMQMTINGGYLGGYNSTTGNVNSTTVAKNNTVNQSDINSPATTYPQVSPLPTKRSKEPVDMAGGAYVHDSSDLILGGEAPLGLSFSRSYNSNMNF
jgi:hypothetical protein